jgi:hypothetical protein
MSIECGFLCMRTSWLMYCNEYSFLKHLIMSRIIYSWYTYLHFYSKIFSWEVFVWYCIWLLALRFASYIMSVRLMTCIRFCWELFLLYLTFFSFKYSLKNSCDKEGCMLLAVAMKYIKQKRMHGTFRVECASMSTMQVELIIQFFCLMWHLQYNM